MKDSEDLLECMNRDSSLAGSFIGKGTSISGNLRWLLRILLPHKKGKNIILARDLVSFADAGVSMVLEKFDALNSDRIVLARS